MRKLWYNGNVVSMDRQMTRYEAVGVEDGRIVCLGSTAEALSQSWDETEDLGGATVLPGFTDSHMHLLHYALFQKNVALFGVESIDKLIQLCRARIDRDKPDCELEVDGGIDPVTCKTAVANGANVLVAGSAVYKAEDISRRIAELRG